MLLSVIIPAYNEEQRLGPQLAQVLGYVREHYPDAELIVVDDGSRDGTAQVVQTALENQPKARLISYQPNRGKGYAIRQGVLASRGEAVLFLDADLSTPLSEIPRALAELATADVVIGSRDLPGTQIKTPQPFYRQAASEIFKWVRLGMVGLWQISDTQCGFKAYRGPAARQLFALAQIDRFMFDVEILYLAQKAGLRMREIPVEWNDQPGSKVKFWEGLVHMIRDLWRIRQRHRGPVKLSV
jgi:dolichyl-phosphate beta-glucosyltransferase